ncbi:hypothetical protein PoB_000772800 [Plakobranchus ocellatus]|uniref:Uncharacterized protein n=1 Tax=Plakobranchus ocellatus TaxID=259542 RepID=A0AAV3YFP2_9GAST|nr:hypothetical protein PoB_000772800 [Plakobranchus ocellatus]
MISGFQALGQASAPVAGLDPTTECCQMKSSIASFKSKDDTVLHLTIAEIFLTKVSPAILRMFMSPKCTGCRLCITWSNLELFEKIRIITTPFLATKEEANTKKNYFDSFRGFTIRE